MTAKEQLLGIIDFIGENEAIELLVFAKAALTLKLKTWSDIEEDEPTPDEVAAFNEYFASKLQ